MTREFNAVFNLEGKSLEKLLHIEVVIHLKSRNINKKCVNIEIYSFLNNKSLLLAISFS